MLRMKDKMVGMLDFPVPFVSFFIYLTASLGVDCFRNGSEGADKTFNPIFQKVELSFGIIIFITIFNIKVEASLVSAYLEQVVILFPDAFQVGGGSLNQNYVLSCLEYSNLSAPSLFSRAYGTEVLLLQLLLCSKTEYFV